jgi:hypothetical protein
VIDYQQIVTAALTSLLGAASTAFVWWIKHQVKIAKDLDACFQKIRKLEEKLKCSDQK